LIEAIHSELSARGCPGVEIQRLHPNVLSRQPLGQVDFEDLVISFVVGVASNATYAWLKARLDDHEFSGHVEIIELGLSKELKSADSQPPDSQRS